LISTNGWNDLVIEAKKQWLSFAANWPNGTQPYNACVAVPGAVPTEERFPGAPLFPEATQQPLLL
jgi:hypothetical protein